MVKSTGAQVAQGFAGAAVTAGQPVIKVAADGLLYPSDSDHATVERRNASGIALNSAGIGQPVVYETSGDINLGATLTPGAPYFVSSAAGAICPAADLSAGEAATILGVARSASILSMNIFNSGCVT